MFSVFSFISSRFSSARRNRNRSEESRVHENASETAQIKLLAWLKLCGESEK